MSSCDPPTGNVKDTPHTPKEAKVQIETSTDEVVIRHKFTVDEDSRLGDVSTTEYSYLVVNGMNCLRIRGYQRLALDCDWSTFDPDKVPSLKDIK